MNAGSQNLTFDALTQLKDAGLVAASAAAQVAGSNKILDLSSSGPSGSTAATPPEMRGTVVIDVSAIELDTANEVYTIILQGSSSSSFASDIVNYCQLELAAAAVASGGSDVAGATGRYLLPFTTNRNGTTRRYLRLYTKVAGTIATGINYIAWVAKQLPSGM